MKRLVLSLALAAAASLPIAASAQQAPPAPPTQAQRQQMRANFEQMRKLHDQFRAQVLGALTPEHRQLLAQVVGNLAVADHPDRKAAAAQLDAALSPGEKSAILGAANQMRDQMKSLMANMPKPPGAMQHPPNQKREHRTPTAGGILLMATGEHGMMGGRGFRGGPGGPPPPQH
jgi:hypothetical protein